jgi:dTDP-D-glucose 4,6-dehydratase
VADVGKIARELDWRPRLSVEEGFRAMAGWFAERGGDDALAAYSAASHAPRSRGSG